MKKNKLNVAFDPNLIKQPGNFVQTAQNFLAALSDYELWNKFKDGDEASFIFIYKEYFKPLYQYGSQFTSNLELVEDSIQDLFIELRDKREKIIIQTSIKFYLFKSLKRKVIALLEKNKRYFTLEELPEYIEFEVSYSIEQRLIESQIKKEQRQKLHESMHKLTFRQREALYYFYYEDMTYSEIQNLMNFTHIQAARNLMYRALKELKSSLSGMSYITLLFSTLPTLP